MYMHSTLSFLFLLSLGTDLLGGFILNEAGWKELRPTDLDITHSCLELWQVSDSLEMLAQVV